MNVKKGNNAFGLFQIDGGDLLIRLYLGMSLLQKRLKLVDVEDLLCGVCVRIEVGNQWKYAIRRFVFAYGILVDAE